MQYAAYLVRNALSKEGGLPLSVHLRDVAGRARLGFRSATNKANQVVRPWAEKNIPTFLPLLAPKSRSMGQIFQENVQAPLARLGDRYSPALGSKVWKAGNPITNLLSLPRRLNPFDRIHPPGTITESVLSPQEVAALFPEAYGKP
jgi:hypothetical protein